MLGARFTKSNMYKHLISGTAKKLQLVAVIIFLLPISVYAETAPQLSVYLNNTQTIPAATFTAVQFDTVLNDTTGAWSPYMYVPKIAGFYQVAINVGCTADCKAFITLNGTPVASGVHMLATAGGNIEQSLVSKLIYVNGITDQISAFVFTSPGTDIVPGIADSYMTATYVSSLTPSFSTSGATTSAVIIDAPNLQIFAGILLFISMMWFAVWLFIIRRK